MPRLPPATRRGSHVKSDYARSTLTQHLLLSLPCLSSLLKREILKINRSLHLHNERHFDIQIKKFTWKDFRVNL